MRWLLLGSIGFCVSACASILEGTSQEIIVNSDPQQADCVLARNGLSIGSVRSTPGSVTVQRTKNDIRITCNKEGFHESVLINESGLSAWVAGNVVSTIFLPITAGIDSASGADNKYDSPAMIRMVPTSEPPPEVQYSSGGADEDDDD